MRRGHRRLAVQDRRRRARRSPCTRSRWRSARPCSAACSSAPTPRAGPLGCARSTPCASNEESRMTDDEPLPPRPRRRSVTPVGAVLGRGADRRARLPRRREGAEVARRFDDRDRARRGGVRRGGATGTHRRRAARRPAARSTPRSARFRASTAVVVLRLRPERQQGQGQDQQAVQGHAQRGRRRRRDPPGRHRDRPGRARPAAARSRRFGGRHREPTRRAASARSSAAAARPAAARQAAVSAAAGPRARLPAADESTKGQR